MEEEGKKVELSGNSKQFRHLEYSPLFLTTRTIPEDGATSIRFARFVFRLHRRFSFFLNSLPNLALSWNTSRVSQIS